jgi:hypothetical protein
MPRSSRRVSVLPATHLSDRTKNILGDCGKRFWSEMAITAACVTLPVGISVLSSAPSGTRQVDYELNAVTLSRLSPRKCIERKQCFQPCPPCSCNYGESSIPRVTNKRSSILLQRRRMPSSYHCSRKGNPAIYSGLLMHVATAGSRVSRSLGNLKRFWREMFTDAGCDVSGCDKRLTIVKTRVLEIPLSLVISLSSGTLEGASAEECFRDAASLLYLGVSISLTVTSKRAW